MNNGQLKPGYNLQISTNDQFITYFSIHQNPTDTRTLIPHLEGFKTAFGKLPEELTADAGYGSEENYLYLEDQGVEAYVKYNTFDISKKQKKWADKYPFHANTLHYDAANDQLICPMGQPMRFIGVRKTKTSTGFIQHSKRYQARRCQDCPVRGRCHKSKADRIVEINFNVRELRERSKQRLESPRGIENRKKRPVDVEPVFGHIKHNRGFKRFMLRGLDKVEIETGLVAIAHNLKKIGA